MPLTVSLLLPESERDGDSSGGVPMVESAT
jgi:hypothetical protein